MNNCAYIGCRRPCSSKFCNAEHALKQERVVAVLAERKNWSAEQWTQYERQRWGRHGARFNKTA